LAIVAALLAAGLGSWAASAQAARIVPESQARQAMRFWTPARMKRARPLDGLRAGAPSIVPTAEQAVASSPHVVPPLAPSGDTAGASSASETVLDPTLPLTRTNGVIFIVLGPFALGRCSGTSVNAPNFSVVFTAAHCIRGGGPRGDWFPLRWVFVPGYRYGQRPFGVFPAKWMETTRLWRMTGSQNFDVGAVVVSRNEGGRRLGKVVGGTGIAWGLKPRQVFDVHGYSAEPPFDGETQQLCAQTPFLGHDPSSFLVPGPLNLAVECEVTGGASGGGWTIEGNVLNSITSYGYGGESNIDFGPYFGKEVGRLYSRARQVR
jgi:hypothetical protein